MVRRRLITAMTIDFKYMEPKNEERIWRVAARYVAIAEDYAEVNPNIIEGAKNLLAEDILMFEQQEEYEVCLQLKKAFEYLDQVK